MSIKYLAGRTFDVGTDTVEPGDELSEEQVRKTPGTVALVYEDQEGREGISRFS